MTGSSTVIAGSGGGHGITGWVERRVGGPARAKVVVVLAAVLALDGADKGTVSAAATDLKASLGVSNTQLGLLVTVTALVGAAATLPVGALTDSVRRTWLISGTVTAWGLAMIASALAPSYLWLLLARLVLGAVTATAGPTVASLTGDYFPARDRARMYGFILAGELVGTGLGFLVSGYLAAHLGWRYSFAWLAIPSLLLAVVLWRLAEPARGGQSRLKPGQQEIPEEREVAGRGRQEQQREEREALQETREDASHRDIRDQGIAPDDRLVLQEDPRHMSFWAAARYILRIRTDVIVILSSSLVYFYFTGLRTFVLVFAEDHYGLSESAATNLVIPVGLGALVGVYLGGRFSDRLLDRGHPAARVLVPTVVLLAIAPVLAPAFLVTNLYLAVPLLTVGAGLLAAANPPQDAARLDIIHPNLWGRSEGVRTALRQSLEAAAPVSFGLVADRVFGGSVSFAGQQAGARSDALGLTFLVFLIALVAAGIVVSFARRTYPRDVATADASVAATLEHAQD